MRVDYLKSEIKAQYMRNVPELYKNTGIWGRRYINRDLAYIACLLSDIYSYLSAEDIALNLDVLLNDDYKIFYYMIDKPIDLKVRIFEMLYYLSANKRYFEIAEHIK
jgi:hypothetical protein